MKIDKNAFHKQAGMAWHLASAMEGVIRRLLAIQDKLSDTTDTVTFDELSEMQSTLSCLSAGVDNLGNELDDYASWATETNLNLTWPPDNIEVATYYLKQSMLAELHPKAPELKSAA